MSHTRMLIKRVIQMLLPSLFFRLDCIKFEPNGPFRKCQAWALIPVHGQYQSNRLGLYCLVTIWPKNTKERPLHEPSQDQSKSTALGGVCNFAEQCIGAVIPSDQSRPKPNHCTYVARNVRQGDWAMPLFLYLTYLKAAANWLLCLWIWFVAQMQHANL